ncbi:YkgJ family cysteine cluster protein [Methylocapsa palsarum]|uniref:Putative zinc-or iron-chelating domain-containing protein n=1 Tax=Methylocapsa palsarum TaxID=1612308 RepID=A0A1I3XZH4_9HYPH|nr:YkgJ family cysteine cluster protein [Methylocapsa palsarum]SFK24955.1 Putative zinc-or iron-chelating domain-containing protein [Methylocapsa palsarum]
MMTTFDGLNHIAFFKALYGNFCKVLVSQPNEQGTIGVLIEDCFRTFESNSANAVGVVCHGGCASCCAIRVAATAPEILLIARVLRSSSNAMGFELRQKIDLIDRAARRLDEQGRMTSGSQCPFIEDGLCVIYAARPLACRGHASYDEQACINALAGVSCDVPISELHLTVRSLVQNAMQAASRDSGYAWGTYELNHALQIALTNKASETAWLNGEDVFGAALITDVSPEKMAETFDAIKAIGVNDPSPRRGSFRS